MLATRSPALTDMPSRTVISLISPDTRDLTMVWMVAVSVPVMGTTRVSATGSSLITSAVENSSARGVFETGGGGDGGAGFCCECGHQTSAPAMMASPTTTSPRVRPRLIALAPRA